MADNVLLITEDSSIAQKVRDACRELEASLTHLGTLKDAAEKLAATPPDLILCDYSTFEVVREQFPRACVLLYTEPADSEQAIEAIKRGALDYLVRCLYSAHPEPNMFT